MKRLLTTTCLIGLGMTSAALGTEDTGRHYSHVMGTSLDIRITGLSAQKADRVIDQVSAEIKRLEAIFSARSDTSELAVLNRAEGPRQASREMIELLTLCEEWYEKSRHGVSCRMGALLNDWREATQAQQEPDRADMRHKTYAAHRADLAIDVKQQTVLRPLDMILDPTGLAKGYILDQALLMAQKLAPKARGIKIDSGGDAVYWGQAAEGRDWKVAVADPLIQADNGVPLAMLSLKSKAIASSGHQARGFEIGRKSFSHILNTRDGWPVEYAPAATVIAPDAVTADALATALTTLRINSGLDLINSLPDVEALIVAPDGRQFASKNWYSFLEGENLSRENAWKENFGFKLDYIIPEMDEGNYEAPYVTIWVTDENKKLVRSLLLLGQRSRWMEENYIWWRRYGRKYESVVDGVSRQTRLPGRYQLVWDGRDDFGNILPDTGKYTLHIEASREYGGHNYKRIPLDLDQGAFTLQEQPDGEIGAVTINFGPASG